MTANPTMISISGKVSYSDEITIAQAAQIIAFLNTEGEDTSTLGTPLLGDTSAAKNRAKKVESAREALEISGAVRNPERIVALGAYVIQDGGDTFKVEDVKSAFRRARETAPANFTRDLGAAVSAGWLGEDESGEFYLTNKMGGILDGGFKFPKSGNGSRTGSTTRKSTSATKTTKNGKPDVFASLDVIPSTMEGFPPLLENEAEQGQAPLGRPIRQGKRHHRARE